MTTEFAVLLNGRTGMKFFLQAGFFVLSLGSESLCKITLDRFREIHKAKIPLFSCLQEILFLENSGINRKYGHEQIVRLKKSLFCYHCSMAL